MTMSNLCWRRRRRPTRNTVHPDAERGLYASDPYRRHNALPDRDGSGSAHGAPAIWRHLTLSSSSAGLSGRGRRYQLTGGFATACGAIEALSLSLAGELGPHGICVVYLRPDAIPETWPTDHIESRTYMENGTVLGRLPPLVCAQIDAYHSTKRSDDLAGSPLTSVLSWAKEKADGHPMQRV
jgi:NAD(P)-dependent dehydrogenase (short-subunit alcohol dehydrogenase family)